MASVKGTSEQRPSVNVIRCQQSPSRVYQESIKSPSRVYQESIKSPSRVHEEAIKRPSRGHLERKGIPAPTGGRAHPRASRAECGSSVAA
jgi:hypothetical protein